MDEIAFGSKQIRNNNPITGKVFYFGEVDHEKGGGGANGFIHTQNQILTLLN
jgi:hypothetical protein